MSRPFCGSLSLEFKASLVRNEGFTQRRDGSKDAKKISEMKLRLSTFLSYIFFFASLLPLRLCVKPHPVIRISENIYLISSSGGDQFLHVSYTDKNALVFAAKTNNFITPRY